MGNYILDFVNEELLKYKKKKEKISEQESSYILEESIKKQEKVISSVKGEGGRVTGIENGESSIENSLQLQGDNTLDNGELETNAEFGILNSELDENSNINGESRIKNSDLDGKNESLKEKTEETIAIASTSTIADKSFSTTSLRDLEKEKTKHEIPEQQKEKDSVVSNDIMNILDGNQMEKSILSFNEEEEDMNLNKIKEEKPEKEVKKKKVEKKKNKVKVILFQLAIGAILIFISVLYLVESPAEQKVLRSGMGIWIDKVKVILSNTNSYFKNKFLTDLEDRKKNIVYEIESVLEVTKNCELKEGMDIEKDIEQLEGLQEAIELMSLETFEAQHINLEMQVESIKNGEIIKKCY